MRRLIQTAILFSVALCGASAQQVVAPTPEPVGPVRGDNTAEYNIVNSFETGYRWRSIGGSLDEYRSQVNYGSGLRLLGSFLTINSRDGHGRFLDEVVLTTQGLGNDPYESATLRIQKNRLYRYDMTWQLNDYVNPGLTSDGQEGGSNALDTRYTTQDHDLTLFPQSKIKFFLGYSRGFQEGPALIVSGGLEAPVQDFGTFTSIREERNEYRVGNEVEFHGFKLNWVHGWEDFKEDYNVNLQSEQGPNAGGSTASQSFERTHPYHGTSPYWRVILFTDRKWFSVNSRFTYTGTRRAFVLQQSALGGGLPGGAQVTTLGNGRRPVATGNLTFSIFPTSKIMFTNSTAVYSVRTEGNSDFIQLNNFTGAFDTRSFQYLGIRTLSNQSDLNYQASKWLGLFAGYHYSDRLIRSVLDAAVPPFEQTSILNAGVFGVRLRPLQPVTIVLNGEVGRANHPFTPKSDRNYQALGARLQYKHKSLLVSAYTQANYNNNSTALTAYSSHARTYAANVSWAPLRWLSFDADYSKLHLDTLGGLSFFDNGELLQGEHSLYISNLQTGNAGVRFVLGKRVNVYAGYSHVQDTGDGRNNLYGSGFGPDIPEFRAAQTFPLKYQSPVARLSIKLTNRIRWNAGYQYYGYHEDFFTGQAFTFDQAYRAHTGYTSVLWSF